MKLQIQKIRLSELGDFVKSNKFNDFETVPITTIRAQSFLNNPNGDLNDVVLYLGFVEDQLVAFRSLFAGLVNSGDEQIRFGWCSGNWVHPNFRRKGFSEKLLTKAYSDWDKKLMFTNYAPNSEKLYLKTGWFQAIHNFDGVRAYLFPKTRKLIRASNKNSLTKLLFSILDFFIVQISTFRLLFLKSGLNSEIKFKTFGLPDKECFELIQNIKNENTFNRNEIELKWIFQFPWISKTDTSFSEKYPFSSFSESFYYQTIKVYKNEILKGLFVFSVRNRYLKTLFFKIPDGMEKEISKFLKHYCKTHKIEMLTVYKKEIAKQFFNQKFPFLKLKKYGQKIYSTFKIKTNEKYQFQDGDGDVFFT